MKVWNPALTMTLIVTVWKMNQDTIQPTDSIDNYKMMLKALATDWSEFTIGFPSAFHIQ